MTPKTPVTPVATEMFNFPEHRENARKSRYFSWKIVCHGVLTATKALPRSSHGVLSRSYSVHGRDSLRSHGAFTACPQRMRRAFTALRTQWHLQEHLAVSMQRQRTATAFAQRPLCAPTELLLRCRRLYCAATVTLRRPLFALLGIRANAEWRCLFWVCSKCAMSLGVLCDPTVSNGDATALLRWCSHSYCVHLGVLHFLGHRGITVRTPPWCDRGSSLACCFQCFICLVSPIFCGCFMNSPFLWGT